jgi:hypothetical protein
MSKNRKTSETASQAMLPLGGSIAPQARAFLVFVYTIFICYNTSMARKFVMKPVAKQNRNNNHKHSDKRKHPRLKNGR